MAAAFRSEEVLIKIGALDRQEQPDVVELTGRLKQWDRVETAHVVVALPNSISPGHYQDDFPPKSFFDLVVVDEAHHTPAPTWRLILDHFGGAKAVLLTATPRRRDGQRLPGDHIYHYPLRQALDEGIFKPVDVRVLVPADEYEQHERCLAILETEPDVVRETLPISPRAVSKKVSTHPRN